MQRGTRNFSVDLHMYTYTYVNTWCIGSRSLFLVCLSVVVVVCCLVF